MTARLASERDKKIALVRAMLEARLSGRNQDFADYFTEDGVFTICGDPAALRCAGRWAGRSQIIEAVRFFDSELRSSNLQVDTPLLDGDNIAVRWSMTIARRGGGGAADTRCSLWLRLRGNLISDFTLATDTALIDAIVHGSYYAAGSRHALRNDIVKGPAVQNSQAEQRAECANTRALRRRHFHRLIPDSIP